MVEILSDAAFDALIIFPILFVIYILLEIFEHNRGKVNQKILKGKYAPLFAGAVGLIPECGFSVAASSLYAQRYIAVGTLLTVFISTSDEAIPILLASHTTAKYALIISAIKFCYGVAVGLIVNMIVPKKAPMLYEENKESCSHCHGGEDKIERYLINPLMHAIKIVIFIFVVNLIMNLIIAKIGEDRLGDYLAESKLFQPFIAALVGMIPSCASSVVLTEVFVKGGLTLGSLIAGLSVNAGLGYIVLFKQNKNLNENIKILLSAYILSVFLGTVISVI